MKKERKMKKWIHTQNTRRFPGFTVVVVTVFVKILDDFHDFVSECVSFQRKINNPFWEVTFFRRKVTNFIGREAKTHILPTKINEKIAKVSPSNNNYSFKIKKTIQQQTTTLRSLFGSSRGHVARLEPMASISSPSAQTASLLVDGHPRRVGVGLPVPTLDDVVAGGTILCLAATMPLLLVWARWNES